jgi:hypothetical protein
MVDALATNLEEIIKNTQLPEPLRVLAKETLTQWDQGIIPSRKVLKQLSVGAMPPKPCSRPDYDGSCVWLRKNGKELNLPVAPVGEPAKCCFVGTFHKCPGYKP